MSTRSFALPILKAAALGLALAASVLVLAPGAAEARARVFLGFNFFGPPPVYYYPPPAYYYYPPPPVYYYPPPPAYGTVTPIPAPSTASQPQSNQNCREYQSTVTVDGKPQASYGTACLQPDGTWHIIN